MAINFAGFFNGKWGIPEAGENTNPAYRGVDTHTFDWSNPANSFYPNFPSQLSFVINPFTTGSNQVFKVADLTYYNGAGDIGTAAEAVPLKLQLELYNPTRVTTPFEFNFDIVSTDNSGTPEEGADYVYPIGRLSLGGFTYQGADYTLKLMGFSQDAGKTLKQEFRVLEGETTDAGLYARIEKVISGSSGNNTLKGTTADNYLNGKAGNDNIQGSGGNDVLIGGTGNDTMNGGDGDDNLYGGGGNDNLTGGGGTDYFTYETGKKFIKSDVGTDKITDFLAGTDKIVLDKETFVTLESSPGQGFSVNTEFAIVTGNTQASTSQAEIVFNSTTKELFYNENGSGSSFGLGGKIATLPGINLQASDFQIQG